MLQRPCGRGMRSEWSPLSFLTRGRTRLKLLLLPTFTQEFVEIVPWADSGLGSAQNNRSQIVMYGLRWQHKAVQYPEINSNFENDWPFRPLVNGASKGLAIGYFEKKKFPVDHLQAPSSKLTQ
jgi:hypothetical protein